MVTGYLTSYLRGSEVFRSFPSQVSVKVCEDICSATATLLCTTRADSAEGFATSLCTSDCVDSEMMLGNSFGFWSIKRYSLLNTIFKLASYSRQKHLSTYKLAVLYVLTCDLQRGSPWEAFE